MFLDIYVVDLKEFVAGFQVVDFCDGVGDDLLEFLRDDADPLPLLFGQSPLVGDFWTDLVLDDSDLRQPRQRLPIVHLNKQKRIRMRIRIRHAVHYSRVCLAARESNAKRRRGAARRFCLFALRLLFCFGDSEELIGGR